MTVSEYARSRGISREAVNKQIRSNPDAFEGHTKQSGRQTELDEVAVIYLDQHRKPRVITVEPIDEEVRQQLAEKDEEIARLQKALEVAQGMVISLQDEKMNLIEERGRNAALLEDRESRLLAAEEKAADQEVMIRTQEQTIAANMQQISDLEKAAEEKQTELESYHKTIFGLFRKKK